MANNQSIKERLLLFIGSLGLGKSQFENACGLSHGWVNGIKVNVSPDKLEKITLQFPDLNTAWLLTGEGPMLKGQAEAGEKPAGGLDQVLEQYQQVLSEMLELRKNNADLTKEVGQIRELQKRLEEERGSLLEQNKKLTDIIERLTKEG